MHFYSQNMWLYVFIVDGCVYICTTRTHAHFIYGGCSRFPYNECYIHFDVYCFPRTSFFCPHPVHTVRNVCRAFTMYLCNTTCTIHTQNIYIYYMCAHGMCSSHVSCRIRAAEQQRQRESDTIATIATKKL